MVQYMRHLRSNNLRLCFHVVIFIFSILVTGLHGHDFMPLGIETKNKINIFFK